MLVFILASIVLALCLTLIEITAFAAFWTVFGLNAIAIVGISVAVAALYCHWAVLFGRRLGVSEALIFFIVVQAVVLASSLLIVAARPLLGPLNLLAQDQPGFFLFRNMLFALIGGFAVSRYLALQQRWRHQVRAEASARLDALQARIRPHFLFNTLNTIASLVRTRPYDAEQAVLDLSDLLRTGLRTDAEHTLAEELELVRGYLRIESQRLGERLRIDWQIDDSLPLDQTIPALLVQPLVENAIVHGIARLPDGGTLKLSSGSSGGNTWSVRVENPWLGSEDAREGDAEGNRMALDNIRQRLELAYGGRASLKIDSTGNRFSAEIRVPMNAAGG